MYRVQRQRRRLYLNWTHDVMFGTATTNPFVRFVFNQEPKQEPTQSAFDTDTHLCYITTSQWIISHLDYNFQAQNWIPKLFIMF